MGSSSSQMQDVTLAAQPRPVAAIDSRFCINKPAKLQEKPHTFHSGLTFIGRTSSSPGFETKTRLLSSRVTLLDVNQTLVANYKQQTFSFKPKVSVYAGPDHDGAPLFKIVSQYKEGDGSNVSLVFTNVLSGVECEIGFVGNWHRRNACFWLDRGRKGNREPVAKVYCPEGVTHKKYHVEIAQNMDTALIVILCAVLTDQQNAYESSTNGTIGAAATGI